MSSRTGTHVVARMYRCPVCNHAEAARIAISQTALHACSYCDTPLLLTLKDADNLLLHAALAPLTP